MLVPENFADRRVCVMGLGYVGLTLAAVLADVGFEVLGVEIRDDVLDQLGRGEPHVHEPGLGPLVARLVGRGRLRLAQHIPAGCPATVFIVTVGTPLGENGRARLDMVEAVTREIALDLKPGDLVVMRSTVKLATTRTLVIPILDATRRPYDLAFCPERTLEGQALDELRRLPQIVGAASLAAGVRAAQFFQFLTPTVVHVGSLEAAEMIKLVDNAQRDVSFAFANEVAKACDALGISAAEVIRAGKLGYLRTNLPLPGPVGGPCLAKDPHILAEGLRELGIEPEIAMAARRLNERQPAHSVAAIQRATEAIGGFPAAPVVALLGIAFKGWPATDDVRGTMARPILDALVAAFPRARLVGWDAVVAPAEIAEFGLDPRPSLESAIAGANLAVIANNHPAFAAMAIETLADSMARPGLFYDFWNNFEARALDLPPGIGYMALGSHGLAVLPVAVS
ncbi:MAG: nucleotide sugar dehydrogenase [Pseudomonadota bacterium]